MEATKSAGDETRALIREHVSDEARAKQLIALADQLENDLMVFVENKPSPVVYVLNLADSCVELGGRCWVGNKDWWKTRCELIEKTKLRFDREEIKFAFPHLEPH